MLRSGVRVHFFLLLANLGLVFFLEDIWIHIVMSLFKNLWFCIMHNGELVFTWMKRKRFISYLDVGCSLWLTLLCPSLLLVQSGLSSLGFAWSSHASTSAAARRCHMAILALLMPSLSFCSPSSPLLQCTYLYSLSLTLSLHLWLFTHCEGEISVLMLPFFQHWMCHLVHWPRQISQ